MLTVPFNPREEKDAFYGDISGFPEQWEESPTITILNLCDAAERAAEMLKAFQKISTFHKRNESGKA